MAPDVSKLIFGSPVPVVSDERLSMRVLVSLNKIHILNVHTSARCCSCYFDHYKFSF